MDKIKDNFIYALIDKIKDVNDKIYADRLNICNNCENLLLDNICGKCCCLVNIKAAIKSRKCPIDKWNSVE